MAQNPFSSSLLLGAPPLRMDFSAPRTELGRTLKITSSVTGVHRVTFQHWTQEARGGGWDGTLCVRHYYGEAVWLKTGHTLEAMWQNCRSPHFGKIHYFSVQGHCLFSE